MSGIIGVPAGDLGNLHNWEVSVVWIVKVSRVVNVDNGLVGRSRGGGVGWVEQPRDVRSAGGRSVLMFSEHSVSERCGQEHGRERMSGEGRRMEDGGKGRDETEGRRTHLYTGEWHRTRCIGFKRGLVYISQEASAISRLGFSVYDIYYHYFIFAISNQTISNIYCDLFFWVSDAELRLVQRDFPPAAFLLCVALRWARVPV